MALTPENAQVGTNSIYTERYDMGVGLYCSLLL